MEYLKKIIELHENAAELLELIVSEKEGVESMEASQKNFKNTFGRTSPQFANEILIGGRKIKILTRSYDKILKQINH